jgi:16S rRNA processing protein RimM
MTAADQWVWLALIRRSQGRKGEVFADILTDFPEKFSERRHLWLFPADTPDTGHPAADSSAPRPIELTAHWLHKGGIVLHFAGVHSISEAEALIGMAVVIPRDERAPLGDDEVYISDLIGCTVIDVTAPQPVTIGTIEDVDRTAGPVALLVLRGAAGEVIIPFAKSYLRSIDLENKRVEMALPEGLADLNAPGKP